MSGDSAPAQSCAKDVGYVLSTGAADAQRLQILNEVYGPNSREFLSRHVLSRLHPATVADVGCGHGQMLFFLAGQLPEARLVGLDISPEQLQIVQSRAAAVGLENITALATHDSHELHGAMDLVYARFVLMHQPDRAALVRLMHGICSSHGMVALEEPCLSSLFTFPHRESVHRANALTLALGRSKGIDYDVGPRLLDELVPYFDIIEASVTQPMLHSAREKSLILFSFLQIAPELVARRIATQTQVAMIIADLEAFTNDACIASGLRIFRVIASKNPWYTDSSHD